jgi:hypothetical protein
MPVNNDQPMAKSAMSSSVAPLKPSARQALTDHLSQCAAGRAGQQNREPVEAQSFQ